MRKILLIAFALPMFLIGCEKNNASSDELIERKDFVLTRSEMDFIQENNGFALELFKKVSDLAKGGSTVISPLSVTIDFGMVNNGAAGATRDEINKVLGYKDGSVDGLNAFCKSILTQSTEVDPTTIVEIGNAAVINKKQVPLNDGFTKTIKTAYDAEVVYKEFGKDDVKGAINKWCNKKTHGMIPTLLEEQPKPNEYAYFLNAVYFKGKWSEPFKTYDTKKEDFTLSDGSRTKVPMMWQEHNFNYGYIPEVCGALCLPYGNEAYRMVILLPVSGKTIEDIKKSLDQETWSKMIKGMYSQKVDVKLPSFETATDVLHLRDALKEMGIKKAFVSGEADFSGMTKEDIFIGDVLHKARIKVDEKGSEAAAVTAIMTDLAAAEPPKVVEFHADRPFIYAITEVSTGAIFFIGQYTGK